MDSNLFNLSINPHVYSSSSDEEKIDKNLPVPQVIESAPHPEEQRTEEVDQLIAQFVQGTTAQFQKDCHEVEKITLDEAERIIQETIKGRTVHFLSAFNLLFIDMMKILQQLSRDRTVMSASGEACFISGNHEEIKGDQVIHLLTVKLHLLFRKFRDYCLLHEGKLPPKEKKENILKAQAFYMEIVNLYSQLNVIIETHGSDPSKDLCRTLKQYCDVLYYLCQHEDLLKRCAKSLSDGLDIETSVLCHPPTQSHMQLYLDSLDICLFSMVHFQKNDLCQPLKQAIEEIKKFPKACFTALPLASLIQSIENFNVGFHAAIKEYLSSCQNIIIQSKMHPSNLKLQACFANLQLDSPIPLLKIFREILPFIIEISTPWNSFRKNQDKMLSKIKMQLQMIHKEFAQSMNSFKQVLKKYKTVEGKTKTFIQGLIDSIEEKTTVQHFLDQVNALIIESIRVPQNTIQEIIIYLFTMHNWNKKADAFHQSLVIPGSPLPCASFTAIDLFIHQVFQVAEIIEVFTATKMVAKSIGALTAIMQAQSKILKIANFDIAKTTNKFAMSLIALTDYLNVGLDKSEQEDVAIQQLKKSSRLLNEYLKTLEINASHRHLASTLLDPLGGLSEISVHDLPIMQQHMHLMATTFSQENVNQQLVELEKATKKKMASAPAGGKFFWKLNCTHVTLAKFTVRETLKAHHQCNQELRACENTDDALIILHAYKKKLKSLDEHQSLWTFQLSLLGLLAKKEGYQEIYESINCIGSWNQWTHFLGNSIHEIIQNNPLPKKALPLILNTPRQDVSDTPSSENDAVELEDEPIQTAPLLMFHEEYIPSSYETNLYLLRAIRAQPLPLMNDQEPIQSYITRATGHNDFIRNSTLYLALIEEAKKWKSPAVPLQMRLQVDHLLLLEATQKIALSCLRIATNETPNVHIILSKHNQDKSLMYTHHGKLLVQLIRSAKKQWFDNLEIQPTIECQESQLQKTYWFQNDFRELPGLALITTCCEKVWKDLDQPKKIAKQNAVRDQAVNFQDCRSKIHKFKRNQTIVSIPRSNVQDVDALKAKITSLQIDPQCHEITKVHVDAIHRVFEFHKSLSSVENKEQMPLFFVTRSAEIQVSLLSLSLILALSTVKAPANQPHPLWLNEKGLSEGRPLFHNHRVNKLWKVLKKHLAIQADALNRLDTYLPLFVGDPRYPFPNKTVMTNELVHMHERVYLLQKIESGWSDEADKKLFTKHLGKGGRLLPIEAQKQILNQAIAKAIEDQEHKTVFAFQLADALNRLDTYLPLFVGDPRYPFPNKTVMTNELVHMHERVYLLQKIESGWSDEADKKLFAKHLGKGGRLLPIEAQKEILKQAIAKAIEDQEHKTVFAFQLAECILRIDV